MKKNNPKPKFAARETVTFAPTNNCIGYGVIFVIAMIFTQALRSSLSSLFFVFIILLPFAMVAYIFIAKATLSIYKISDSKTIEKNEDFTYEFRIINDAILPYPFIDARISLPQKDSVRTAERSVLLSMPPMKEYNVKNTVRFQFRGSYEIGVRCFYVYDFFKLFRLKVVYDNYDTVYVMPRKLYLDDGEAHAMSDSADFTLKSPYSYDKIEISDIRDYRMGDSLKSIHWKLSSKSDEFVVRDYDTGTSKMTYIFADLAARFPKTPPQKDETENQEISETTKPDDKKTPEVKTANDAAAKNKRKHSQRDVAEVSDEQINEKAKRRAESEKRRRRLAIEKDRKKNKNSITVSTEKSEEKKSVSDYGELARNEYYFDMNEYVADGVSELAVAEVLRELRLGNACTIFWYDSRSSSGACAYTIQSMDEFATVFKYFATAPLGESENTVAKLAAMVKDTQNIKLLFVTAAIDPGALSEMCDMPCVSDGMTFGSAEVVLYNPTDRFADSWGRRVYIESCREQLTEHGLKLSEINPSALKSC